MSYSLAHPLFIAPPPPSRSSIFDANSCKLPSSLLLVAPATFLAHNSRTALAFLRGLDRTPSRTRPALPFLDRSGINLPQPRNYFEDLPEISEIIPNTSMFICGAIEAEVFRCRGGYQILNAI